MSQRSAVAKLCRAQTYPPRSSRLARMTNSLDPDFTRDILPLCQTPLLAGLVLHLVLLAPMSALEVKRIYEASMLKELAVMESIKRECTLNFEPFFGDYSTSIHASVPPNQEVAIRIHICIDQWIESLQKRTLYPKVGSKTVSRWTSAELRAYYPEYEPNDNIGITPIDLERVYHLYGKKIEGPCEMRQKWYCSNLQPRTYYAQGGDAFHSSKYLADPFVRLCDTLPATNRRTRVEPGRIVIRDPTNDIAYYDLTSFTSNLHVQHDFLMRLANYCKGQYVEILDSVLGYIDVDLGDLIYDYTLTNLQNPSYTLPSKYGDPSVCHYHSVAGFLGVYGNIATATFIHGIVMAMRHKHLDENNVAGDDGLDVTDNVQSTLETVGTLGIVQDEKTFRDSEGCCIHLKRPIRRVGTTLIHGHLLSWPSLEPGQTNNDIRYPYFRIMSNRDRISAIAGSITAFLRKLEHLVLSDDELDLVDTFLTDMYRTYNLPIAGCVPQVSRANLGFIPIYERRFIGVDPIHNTITRHYSGVAIVPLRGELKWSEDMFSMTTFQCNSTRLLKHLVILGYLEQEKEDVGIFGHVGLERLLKEYVNPDPPIYLYTILRDLPAWATSVF
jgi:hypothetical protein